MPGFKEGRPESSRLEKEARKETLSERRDALRSALESAEGEAEEARVALRAAEAFAAEQQGEIGPSTQREIEAIRRDAALAFGKLEASKKELSEIDVALGKPRAIEGMGDTLAENMVTEAVMTQVIPNAAIRTVVETVAPYMQESIDKVTGEDVAKKKARETKERLEHRKEE